ncbi:Hypothetical predicted protein [Cloeon dipterum]|uniref:Uncharacterized protein n=1 Tax=Cloeon dipterum TaxID=197152 RepID=A0A8S1DRG7_9INSE|nr:Hypothetical predicted protein [Cloeon dipterum]
MDEERCVQVARLRHLPEELDLLKGVHILPHGDGIHLLIWNSSHVFVFTGADLEELEHKQPAVLNVSNICQVVGNDDSDIVLLLDSKGSLYEWREVVVEDLFQDDEPNQSQPTLLASGFLAVCSSSMSNVFYGLTSTEEKVKLVTFTVTMDALQEHSSLVISRTVPGKCLLNVFQSEVCPSELLSLLCPDSDLNDTACDVAFAKLGGNVVYFCPLVPDESERRVSEVSTIHEIEHIALAREDGSAILAFTDAAVLTVMEAEGGLIKRTDVPCVQSQVVCQVSMDSFFVADLLSSSKVTVGQQSKPLDLQGCVAAACLEENVALALTLHGVLYKVDLAADRRIITNAQRDKPNGLLNRIGKTNELIRQTERAIKEENVKLKELAVIGSAELLKGTFRLQVNVHDLLEPEFCAFDVLVLNNSKYVFLEQNWNLVLCLTCKDSIQTYNQKLTNTLKVGEVVKVVAKFKVSELSLPATLQCQMLKLSTVPSSSSVFSMELPLGLVPFDVASVDLDITYFLTPTSVDPVTEYRQGHPLLPSCEDRLLGRKLHSRQWETNMDLDQVCRVLSQKCAHRAFGAVRAGDRAAFAVAGKRVDLNWADGTLTVSSADLPLILDVLSHLQNCKDDADTKCGIEQMASFSSDFFAQAENVGLAHEYALLTNTCNEELELELQEQLRKLVVAQFELSD